MVARLWHRVRIGTAFAGVLFIAATVLSGEPALAQLTVTLQRAADGTVYEIVIVPPGPLLAGVDEVRVTQIAGSNFIVRACSDLSGSAGGPVSASVGVDPNQGHSLHPYSATLRSSVFTPNDVSAITFVAATASGGGRLTIGTGAGAMEVCRVASDCSAGAVDVPVVPLNTAPIACLAQQTMPGCAAGEARTTLGFGAALSPSPPMSGTVLCGQNPTTDTTVCAPRPADGFTLLPGQVSVFIYDSNLAFTGFVAGVAGFGIDTDGTNIPGCAASENGAVILGIGLTPSFVPPPPLPSPTPTGSMTPIATVTPTPTESPPPTPTPTPTWTPSFTPTTTRGFGIPVISSPTSAGGLLLIAALGIGLLWALRRFEELDGS